jgi:glycosyltransferase involved in cell wall biosynthesis
MMLVSIVIAAYNAEKYLRKAIESCLNQTYQNIEIIIINDGSTDKTHDIIEEYCAKDDRIRAVHQKNSGVGASRNLGNGMAKGEYIVVMDADDIMYPNLIEEQISYLEKNLEVDAVSCWAEYIDERDKHIGNFIFPNDLQTKEQFFEYKKNNKYLVMLHPGSIYRKAALLKVGGYRNIRPSQDSDMWNRLVEQNSIIIVRPLILMKYRLYESSINTSLNIKIHFSLHWQIQNFKRRREGIEEISFEQYMKEFAQKPLMYRLNFKRTAYSNLFARKAMIEKSRSNIFLLFYYLTIAFLLNPYSIIKKIIKQFGGIATTLLI